MAQRPLTSRRGDTRPVSVAATRRRVPSTLGPPPPTVPPLRREAPTIALGAAALGLGIVVALAFSDETAGAWRLRGGPAIFIGSLTGLVGTYLAMLMVLLASRLPFVESALGFDGLLRWHRRLGPWPITLLTIHAVVLIIGYAQAARTGALQEIGALINGYAYMLAAFVGLGLMLMAGFASVRAVRRRVKRETWWVIHLYLYLALALAFAHALVLGPDFVNHPVTKIVWCVVWAATAGSVLVFRFGVPIARSVRHNLVVWEVRRETPDVASIILKGRDLDRLPLEGGQFAEWRFLARGLWWQAHPYTVSGLPQRGYLRITVRGLGDHSRTIARLRRGTRVAFEGPYGVFTAASRRRHRVTLIAAGVGVTSLRPLLEELPAGTQPTVILRAPSAEAMPLRAEIAGLVEAQQGVLHELYGSRRAHVLDARRLRHLVPDIIEQDVYVSGPEDFVADVAATVRRMGVPDGAVHHEAYAL